MTPRPAETGGASSQRKGSWAGGRGVLGQRRECGTGRDPSVGAASRVQRTPQAPHLRLHQQSWEALGRTVLNPHIRQVKEASWPFLSVEGKRGQSFLKICSCLKLL